jgi:hypothetical protein
MGTKSWCDRGGVIVGKLDLRMQTLNPNWQQWLDDRTHVAGVLACGISLPDGQLRLSNHPTSLDAAQVAKACQQIAATTQRILADHYVGHQLSWSFDQMQVLSIKRPDDTLLVLFLSRESNAMNMSTIQQLSDEFRLLA